MRAVQRGPVRHVALAAAMEHSFLIPAPGEGELASPRGAAPGSPAGAGSAPGGSRTRGDLASHELRQVAETLSRTTKVLGAGLAQANEQGQRLRGAISRLERGNEWSTAERRRAEEEISGFFGKLREALRTKEDEMLRDTRGVFAVQDEDNKRRLEELVIQGQKLSKACMAIQALHEGTSAATIGSLNTPLHALLESLESSGRLLEREEEAEAMGRAGTGLSAAEERGVRFQLCGDLEIQRAIEAIDMVHYEGASPPLVLVGTPAGLGDEAQRRRLTRQDAAHKNKLPEVPGSVGGYAAAPARAPLPPPPQQQQQQQQLLQMQVLPPPSQQHHHGRRQGPLLQDPFPAQPNGKMLSPLADRRRGGPPQSSEPQMQVRAVVPFEEDGDNEGVIHWLGRSANTKAFANPALFSPDDPFLVVLRASSRIEGDLASLAGFRHHDGAFFETDSALSSWISVELPLPLAPTHYTLGYFVNGQDHIPRNWVLQGSKDNVSFVTLRSHENDAALEGDMHLATWRIPEQAIAAGPFSYFRVMQTGPTSTGTMFLVLSFIELYGTVFTAPA